MSAPALRQTRAGLWCVKSAATSPELRDCQLSLYIKLDILALLKLVPPEHRPTLAGLQLPASTHQHALVLHASFTNKTGRVQGWVEGRAGRHPAERQG
jgi:hypothetical protein